MKVQGAALVQKEAVRISPSEPPPNSASADFNGPSKKVDGEVAIWRIWSDGPRPLLGLR